jgi:peptide/nickel transport system substrate-binding protein
MRQAPRFFSGRPVTAQDAAFSLQRAVMLNKSPALIVNQFGFTAGNVTELIRDLHPVSLDTHLSEKRPER